jgi:4-hydroxy-tetrahydrodipicolinate synthase
MDTTRNSLWSAMPTPLTSNGAVDSDSLRAVVNQHCRLGITGLFVGGTTGEGPLLPYDQQSQLVRQIKALTEGALHVSAQVSDTSALRVRENMAAMADAGADSVVIAPPWITKFCNRDFSLRYYLESLDAASLPVGIYILSQPPETGMDASFWGEVAGHPSVRYIKDSSGSEETTRTLLKVKASRPELKLLTGNEFHAVEHVAAGYDGGLLGTGILIGGMMRLAFEALANGDRLEADAWQARSNRFLWDLFREDISIWLGGLKYALTRLGIFSTDFTLLSYKLTDEDRSRIDAALEREREFIVPEENVQ